MKPLVRGEWHDVRALAGSLAKPLASEVVALEHAAGRVLAGELHSLVDLPSADVTAMDGWAVSGDGPWRLRGRIVNGRPDGARLEAGDARSIGTGAAVPEGTTAIVRREHAVVVDGVLRWSLPDDRRPDRRDVRPRGEEVAAGEIVLPTGTRLDPVSLAVSAASGHDVLEVVRTPTVDLVVTGDEIVSGGVPAPGSVRDSIGPLLRGMARGAGASITSCLLGDDLAGLVHRLQTSAAELVVTSGGTAVGDADHVREALAAVGATIVVDTVAVRPGGPTVLAVLPDGRLVACLPGNPFAAVAGFMAVVHPALVSMTGGRPAPVRTEVLGTAVAATAHATRLVPFVGGTGGAAPAGRDASSMLRGLATSDGLLVVPPGGARAGDRLDVVEPLWRTTA